LTAETIMLRLAGKRNSRISNRLAVFAALLLVVTSLAGIGNSTLLAGNADTKLAAASVDKSPPVRLHSRGIKVSLFLFRIAK
jgi:hypothetical protein